MEWGQVVNLYVILLYFTNQTVCKAIYRLFLYFFFDQTAVIVSCKLLLLGIIRFTMHTL